MNKEDFPESIARGECWHAFIQQTNWRAAGALGKWLWFLAGWKAKCAENSRHGARKTTV